MLSRRKRVYNMPTFQLSIITPEGKIFDDQIQMLRVPGSEGAFGVLARHAPLVSQLNKGVVKLSQESKTLFYSINSGVIEVDASHNALILCARAINASSEDEAAKLLTETTD